MAGLWLANGIHPNRWDFIGTVIYTFGASVIILAPRGV